MSSPDLQGTADRKVLKFRYETKGPLQFVGLRNSFVPATMGAIPRLWAQFVPFLGNIPGQRGKVAYGIGLRNDVEPENNSIDYAACVEVDVPTSPAGELVAFTVPALRFAVASHDGHVTTVADTINTAIAELKSFQDVREVNENVPIFIERYGEGFDPVTGRGDIEVWIPVESSTEN